MCPVQNGTYVSGRTPELTHVLMIARQRNPSGLTLSRIGSTLLFCACSPAAELLGDAGHLPGEVGAAHRGAPFRWSSDPMHRRWCARHSHTRARSLDGGFYATSTRELPTGFMLDTDPTKPRLYFRLPHLGAASWAALAERGFNPFTATKGLP